MPSAFLTSDYEIPNCRAITEGLTPEMNAARTALSLPVVNEPAPPSAAGRFEADATVFDAERVGLRPRRSASLVTAVRRLSISVSSKRFSAPARSWGKKWPGSEARLSAWVLLCGIAGGSGALAVGLAEKRSSVVSARRLVGMTPTMPPISHRRNRPALAYTTRVRTHNRQPNANLDAPLNFRYWG
jgi:hypothetical protein